MIELKDDISVSKGDLLSNSDTLENLINSSSIKARMVWINDNKFLLKKDINLFLMVKKPMDISQNQKINPLK